MSGSRFCKTCQFWLFTYENRNGKYGTCDHPVVSGKVTVDNEQITDEVIHTEGFFGCIYHTPIHGNVVTKLPS